MKYDIVISTAPYQVLDKLIDLDQNIKNSMNKVEYMSAIVMILTLNNSLSEYYWLSIAENNFPFLGIIEHTNLIPKEKYSDVAEINSSKDCCSVLIESTWTSALYCVESISISGSKPNKSRILILLVVLVLFIEK